MASPDVQLPDVAALFSLRGRAVAVIGGTGSLGAAMARGLVAAGARVAVLGRRAEAGETLAAALRAAGGEPSVRWTRWSTPPEGTHPPPLPRRQAPRFSTWTPPPCARSST